jgi:hypothetical protein
MSRKSDQLLFYCYKRTYRQTRQKANFCNLHHERAINKSERKRGVNVHVHTCKFQKAYNKCLINLGVLWFTHSLTLQAWLAYIRQEENLEYLQFRYIFLCITHTQKLCHLCIFNRYSGKIQNKTEYISFPKTVRL